MPRPKGSPNERTRAARKIAAEFRALGYSREEAARRAKVSPDSVKRWELEGDPLYARYYERAWISVLRERGAQALTLLSSIMETGEDVRHAKIRLAASSRLLSHLEASVPTRLRVEGDRENPLAVDIQAALRQWFLSAGEKPDGQDS